MLLLAHLLLLYLAMAFRIDHIRSDDKTVVNLAGRLTGPAVAQLKRACEPVEGLLVVDLSSLMYADDNGIEALQAIVGKGAKIRGASPFVDLLLKGAEHERRMARYQGRGVWA